MQQHFIAKLQQKIYLLLFKVHFFFNLCLEYWFITSNKLIGNWLSRNKEKEAVINKCLNQSLVAKQRAKHCICLRRKGVFFFLILSQKNSKHIHKIKKNSIRKRKIEKRKKCLRRNNDVSEEVISKKTICREN